MYLTVMYSRVRAQGFGACLVHSQTLQILLHVAELEVTALVAVQLFQYSEATEELCSQCFCRSLCLLVGNDVILRHLVK